MLTVRFEAATGLRVFSSLLELVAERPQVAPNYLL